MANLIFRNSYGEEKVLAEVHNIDEVTREIDNFIEICNQHPGKKHKFKRYYTRIWNVDGRAKFDVGSHSEFFFVDCELPIDNLTNEVQF